MLVARLTPLRAPSMRVSEKGVDSDLEYVELGPT